MKLTLRHWPLLLSLAMVLLATLACGGFQVRVTPAASPSPQAKVQTATPRPANIVTATPTSAPPGTPTAVPTATPPMTTGLAIGKSARVSASGGVNMRDTPSTAGKQVAQLPANSIVTVKDGPKEANDFVWWLIDNGTGSVGWVAMGTKEDPWLTAEKGSGPATSGGKLVSRDVRLGDQVQVTTEDGRMLTVRDAAGIDSPPSARALPGTKFTVRGGPVRQDGYLWWQLEGEQIKGWAAEGSEGDRWLTPIE